MRVLLLNVNRGWAGTETHSITLAEGLRKAGDTVILGCLPEGYINRAAKKSGIPTFDIDLRYTLQKYTASISILRAARKFRPDVIVSNSGNELLPVSIVSRFLNIRTVFFMHSMGRISWLKYRMLTRHITHIVAVSGAVRDYLLSRGIDSRKISVIHNGIDAGRFQHSEADRDAVRAELGIYADERLIGTVARLCPDKGVHVLMRSFEAIARDYPEAKLCFAGEGPSMAELSAMAVEAGLSGRVIFTGTRTDVERIYSAMDIFALPAVWQEPFGLVIIEAMSMRLPTIATAVGGIVEIIRNNENGILVPPGDSESLSRAISRLLEDPGLAGSLADAGRKTAEEEFSSEAMSLKFRSMLGH